MKTGTFPDRERFSGDFAGLCGRASGDASRGAMTFSFTSVRERSSSDRKER